ncbi:DUF805 domain-containing protein [Paludibacterium purpuratum]|uniref:DUF805 domain-containing protein n=1 Tax=Paludibacterium purpuratum TaxID=1144873 RepID=UPI00105F85DD|nr:DUF805 domain-containing protein [Paludibacterium purpuratum]
MKRHFGRLLLLNGTYLPTRIGAGTYTLTMSLAMIAWSLAARYVSEALVAAHALGLSGLHFWVGVFGAAVGVLFWPFSASRMRDLNFPGWAVKVLAFPLLGVILLPLLCFLSGPRWANDYGDPPDRSSFIKVLCACALFACAVLLSFSALIAYQRANYLLSIGVY